MSTDSGGPKKPSTADILAKLRAGKSGGTPESAPAPEPAAATPSPPVTEQAPATPVAPKGGADILAKIRAGKSGGAEPAAAPATGDKPKSTSDIMAALRGKGAAPAQAAPAQAAPAAPASTKEKITASEGGPKPSLEQMLATVRGEAKEAPLVKKVAPPMPAKPDLKPVAKAGGEMPRRGFLGGIFATFALWFTDSFAFAWVCFTGAVTAGTLGMLRFMMPNVLTELPSRFKVGLPSDFDLGTVSEKFKSQYGIWVVHTDRYQGRNMIFALSSVCTHLGCTPSWLDGEQKFKCPCHGSGFYISGVNFEGPAPRPLERVGITISPDGMLEVDKSVKFQEEMGQWNDPASFVEIA